MLRQIRGRLLLLLAGGGLIAFAILVRVGLAATGSYSEGGLAVGLRVASGLALVTGFVVAGVAVAWPMRAGGGHDRR